MHVDEPADLVGMTGVDRSICFYVHHNRNGRYVMIRMLNCCFTFLVCSCSAWAVQPLHAELVVADFENLSPNISYEGPGGGSYWNGSDEAGSFTSGGAVFYNDYNEQYGSWSGWSYSNMVDTVTAGYENGFSAYALVGAQGETNYAVGYYSTFPAPRPVTVELPGAPVGLDVTNTTYAAKSMIYGDRWAKKFGDGDYFLLTILGKDANGDPTGSVEFHLADYAPDKEDSLVRDWTWVDLTSLGADTRKLEFSLGSSDAGSYGINTPTYFAVDNLTTRVPEPGSAALLGLTLLFGIAVYRWRRRRQQA